jgi:hypothetical protein
MHVSIFSTVTHTGSHLCRPSSLLQVGRDNAQELFEKAREWFVNRPIAISRQIREMIAAAHRPPSVAQGHGLSDTFLTGVESGDDDKEAGDLFILPQTSHGTGSAAEADVLPPLPPIGDPRRRCRQLPFFHLLIFHLKSLFFNPLFLFVLYPPADFSSSVLQRNRFDIHAFEPPPPPPPPPASPKCSLMTGILHHEKLRLPAEWSSSSTLVAIADDASARPFNDNVCRPRHEPAAITPSLIFLASFVPSPSFPPHNAFLQRFVFSWNRALPSHHYAHNTNPKPPSQSSIKPHHAFFSTDT